MSLKMARIGQDISIRGKNVRNGDYIRVIISTTGMCGIRRR